MGLPVLLAGFVVGLFVLDRRNPHRGGLALAGKISLSLLVMSILLLGVESYYRFLYDTTDAYQAGLISQRWVSRYYQFNNFGVRDDMDYAAAPPPGKIRVTFLGDSYTNGHGVPDVENRFVNLIREEHPDWDVQMLAKDGLDTGGMLNRVAALKRGGDYGFDLVVYVYCLNDISDLMPELSRAAAALYEDQPGVLVRGSYLFNTYYYRLRIARDPVLARYFDLLAQAYRDGRWVKQTRRLAKLRETVVRSGGTLLVVTFPFFELEGSDEFREIHRQLAEVWDEAGVPHLDLRDSFSGYDLIDLIVNRHDTHPNEFSHGLAADEIGKFIEQNLDRRDGDFRR